MPYKNISGFKGKLYIPEEGNNHKKHDCKDCFSCQMCSDRKCELCLNKKKLDSGFVSVNRNIKSISRRSHARVSV